MGIHALECTSVINSTTTVPFFPSSSKSSHNDISNTELTAIVGSKFEVVRKQVSATNNKYCQQNNSSYGHTFT